MNTVIQQEILLETTQANTIEKAFECIKNRRKQFNFTLNLVSSSANVKVNTIKCIENNTSFVCLESFLNLCYTLGFEFKIEGIALNHKEQILDVLNGIPRQLKIKAGDLYGKVYRRLIHDWTIGIAKPTINKVIFILESIGVEWSLCDE